MYTVYSGAKAYVVAFRRRFGTNYGRAASR
jgi:hypothetical protein